MTLAKESIFLHGDQRRIDHTPSGAVANGQIVLIGTNKVAGFCTSPEGIADGVLGSLDIGGAGSIYKVKKAVSGGVTFAVMAVVAWDDSGNTAVAAGTGTADIGICIKAAVDADDHVVTMPLPGMNVFLNKLAALTVLTDNTTGTADNTLAALPTLTDSPASADALRDDINTNLYPVLKNNFADLAAKVNAILAALST